MTMLELEAVGSAGMAGDLTRASGIAALEDLRRPLTSYCHRMLGSAFDAEDAVQETFFRAWQRTSQLRDERAERAWIYRIATNVCLDMLRAAKRRALPGELGPPALRPAHPGQPSPESDWIWPAPDDLVTSDPAEIATERETVRLAFIAALQLLPPRQRAILILRDVLAWRAGEVAELLDITPVAVNSALQRARETISAAAPDQNSTSTGAKEAALLNRYIQAFERFDLDN